MRQRRGRLLIVAAEERVEREFGRLIASAEPSLEVVTAAMHWRRVLTAIAATEPDVVVLDARLARPDQVAVVERLARSPRATRLVVATLDARDQSALTQQVREAIRFADGGVDILSEPTLRLCFGRLAPLDADVGKDELQALRLAADGARLEEIATAISVSRATAGRMIAQIQRKLRVANRDQMVACAARRGWV